MANRVVPLLRLCSVALVLVLLPDITFNGVAAEAAARPNLLLLFPDEWRFDWDGLDPPSKTKIPLRVPFVEKAAALGTRFTRAVVPSPVCAPSRSCLAAGREYDSAGVPSNFQNDYPVDQPTFYKLLRDDGGYWTMTVGKDDLTKSSQIGYRLGHEKAARDGTYHQREVSFGQSER